MVPIPGKGLGVIALRNIPAMTRIMVDRGYSFQEAKNDPRFKDLYPSHETGIQALRSPINARQLRIEEHSLVLLVGALGLTAEFSKVGSQVRIP